MLKELIVKIGADTSEFVRRIGQVQQTTGEVGNSFRNLGTRMTDTFTGIGDSLQKNGQKIKDFGQSAMQFVSLPLLAGAGASVKLASDMQESLNKVNVAFGDSANQVIQWSKTSIENMGLASGSALDAAALFGDMATSMGFSQSQASNMSTSLVQLGADLSSFKNIPIDQAMTALNGVFTGETESLKTLGVVMTQTQLEAFALSLGIQKNIKDFSQAEMVQLRYQYVLAKTTNAQGDFARTSEGTANQTRMFWENLKQVGTQIGEIILPYFNKLVSFANEMIKSFGDLSDTTKKIVVVIGALGIGLPPLIFAFGVLATSIPTLVAGFRLLGSVMSLSFLNPIGLIIGALVGLGIFLYKTQGSIENIGRYFEQYGQILSVMWNKILLSLGDNYYDIKKLFVQIELTIVQSLSSLTNFFGISVDSIDSEVSRLQKKLNDVSTDQLDFRIQKNGEIAKSWANVYKIEVAKSISNAQDAMANASYSMKTVADMAHNAGQQAYDARSGFKGLGDGMEDAKKKAEELARATEELRKKNLDLATTLTSGVVTALKNRNKAIEESIDKVRESVAKEKSALTDLLKHNEDTYKQIQDITEQAYQKQVDTLKDRYNTEFNTDENATQQKIDEVEKRKALLDNVLKEESNLVADQNFEAKKQAILSEMYTFKNYKNRTEIVDAFAKLMIDREKELNKDGNTLRIESMWQLTEDENKIIRDRVNNYRQTQLNAYNQEITDIKANAVKAQAEKKSAFDLELQTLADNNKKKRDQDKADFDLAQEQAKGFYADRIKVFNDEIAEKKKGLMNLTTEEKAQLKARQLLLQSDHEEVKKLLQSYNADYFSAGKNYGEELLKGLASKKVDINNLVGEIASPSKKANTPTTTKIDWVGAGKSLVNTITDSIGSVIDQVAPSLTPAVASTGFSMMNSNAPSTWSNMIQDYTNYTPQIYLDSKEITKSIAPVMVDYVRTKTGITR